MEAKLLVSCAQLCIKLSDTPQIVSHAANRCAHRIIDARIEKYDAYVMFSQSRIAAMKNRMS